MAPLSVRGTGAGSLTRLQRIEQEILQHALPPPDSLTRPVSRALPLPVTSFVGRDEDRLAVADLLGEVRLLTLHGPGGVGKTRLALEVTARIGHRYRDGVCFCDLAAIRRLDPISAASASWFVHVEWYGLGADHLER